MSRPRKAGLARKTPVRRVRPATNWKKALRSLQHRIIVARDKACLRCGKWREGEGRGFGMQAAHIYGKAIRPRMEFDNRNVILLCQPCHYWWHTKGFGKEAGPRNEVREWCVAILGASRMALLDRTAAIRPIGRLDPKIIRLALEAEARALGVDL